MLITIQDDNGKQDVIGVSFPQEMSFRQGINQFLLLMSESILNLNQIQ